MKSLRIEFFQNPPRERVLVDGVEQKGVTVEVAFLDCSAGEVTIADFVYRLGAKGSTAEGGSDKDKVTETKEERENTLPFRDDKTGEGNTPKPPSNG